MSHFKENLVLAEEGGISMLNGLLLESSDGESPEAGEEALNRYYEYDDQVTARLSEIPDSFWTDGFRDTADIPKACGYEIRYGNTPVIFETDYYTGDFFG